MSSNGPPRSYYGALKKMNSKTCAKGTKLMVYSGFSLKLSFYFLSSQTASEGFSSKDDWLKLMHERILEQP